MTTTATVSRAVSLRSLASELAQQAQRLADIGPSERRRDERRAMLPRVREAIGRLDAAWEACGRTLQDRVGEQFRGDIERDMGTLIDASVGFLGQIEFEEGEEIDSRDSIAGLCKLCEIYCARFECDRL